MRHFQFLFHQRNILGIVRFCPTGDSGDVKIRKKSAGEIGEKFDMTGATISYHLSILRKADLVRESKFKNFVYYELNTCVFEEIMLWFSQFDIIQNDIDGGTNDEGEEAE